MNIDRLKQAESNFLQRYPGGFNDPELVPILKKHKLQKMTDQCNEQLGLESFNHAGPVLDSLIKIVSRSSMVSMFEKPKLRDYVNSLDIEERQCLARGFKALLHGDQKIGFNDTVSILAPGKLAKWSLITICLAYLRPEYEVFVKPTTVKKIIQRLALQDLEYKPQPYYAFYENFRTQINEMKTLVNPTLSTSNAAFSGFLMMAL